MLQKPSDLDKTAIESISAQTKALAAGEPPDWSDLGNCLPSSVGTIGPGGFTTALVDGGEPSQKELICRELNENLAVLRVLMERISRDRKTTASDDEIRAVHNISGTTALGPLSREPGICPSMRAYPTQH